MASDEQEFKRIELLEKQGCEFTIQKYQFEDDVAEIIGPIGGLSVEVRQYDMEFYQKYLDWKSSRVGGET